MTDKKDEPAPNAPANPPAKEAAPAAPAACGCGAAALRDELAKEKEAHGKAKEAHGATLAALKTYEDREVAALKTEAAKLGVPVEDSDGIPCLQKKLALARAVLAKAPKAEAQAAAPTRHTAPNVQAADDKNAALRRLTARMGIDLGE